MVRRVTLVTSSLMLAACGDDLLEPAPTCDEIGWPLGVAPVVSPPLPEYAVECADGWGNAVATRPAVETVAASGWATWLVRPHPDGGWLLVIMPKYDPAWTAWLEQQGADSGSLPDVHVLVRVEDDGSLGWAVPEFGFWDVQVVGDQLWALAGDDSDTDWLLTLDPASGEPIGSRAWDLGGRYNQLDAARDAAGGAWISAIEDLDGDQVEQRLYRAATIDALELVATRTTADPRQAPSGGQHPLQDGGVAWWTGEGFEVIDPDGSVRWARSDGIGAASDDGSMLITSTVPTGVGAGQSLRLEKVALADGATLWTRDHRRYDVVEPDVCGPDDCGLVDLAYPTLRPDGGYLLVGYHAYPSRACPWQPLIMAVSPDGEAEWAHRVESCGVAGVAAVRSPSMVEVWGLTGKASESGWAGAWTRRLEL